VLTAFGAQAALAIENARRHGEIRDRGDRLQEQNRMLRQQLSQHVTMAGMISRNARMLDLFSRVQKIARSDIPSVLIHGESGTGKELIARAIHELSARRDGPFEAVNCSAIPHTLFESTLFGHIKGAFTGADSDRAGHFEVANGGTLFLDEVGELPLEVQPKLLRALQQREITRVGETGHVRRIDVRVVTATNRDVLRAVEQGAFRADLYYRLNTAELYMPPLRERAEDILPLAEYFLQRLAEKRKQPAPQLSRDARRYLLANPWQGNVRELENVMEFAFAFQDEHAVIHADAFERKSQGAAPVAPVESEGSLREMLARYEQRLIRDTLARNDYNVSSSAKVLGLSRQMLHEKIRKYGIVTRDE
jgi:transcriptional regulator with GAF, ATPase, and Fis domain